MSQPPLLALEGVTKAFGGVVGPAGEVVHGKTSRVRHEGGPLFSGIPSPFPVGRYHSPANKARAATYSAHVFERLRRLGHV